MNYFEICTAAKNLTDRLIALSAQGDINPLLTPENLNITETGITLINETVAQQAYAIPQSAGFAAPEVYSGQSGPQAQVYFMGAVLYMLIFGVAPVDAQMRSGPAMENAADPLMAAANCALQLDASLRFANLTQLAQALEDAKNVGLAAVPPAQEPAAPSVDAAVAAIAPQAIAVPPQAGLQAPQADMQAAATMPPQQNMQPPQADMSAPMGSWQAPSMQGAPPQAMPYVAGPPPKKKGKAGVIAAIIIIFAVLATGGGLVGYNLWQVNSAEQAFAERRYLDVVTAIDSAFLFTEDMQQEYNYSRAKVLFEQGNFEESLAQFEALGNFYDSAELVSDIRYNQALDMLNRGETQAALEIFIELEAYLDSAEYVQNIEAYMQAEAQGTPLDRMLAFNALDGFLDSSERASALAAEVYDEAVALYNSQSFEQALPMFENITFYSDATAYLQICNIWQAGQASEQDGRARMAEVEALSETIDIVPLISSNPFNKLYLEGNWSDPNSNSTFMFDWDERLYEFDGELGEVISGSYTIQGNSWLADEDNPNPSVTFNYISYNTVGLALSNGDAYVLTRD